MVPALVFGVTWCVTRMVRDVVVGMLRPRSPLPSRLGYEVRQDSQGRWLVCQESATEEFNMRNLPHGLLE